MVSRRFLFTVGVSGKDTAAVAVSLLQGAVFLQWSPTFVPARATGFHEKFCVHPPVRREMWSCRPVDVSVVRVGGNKTG